MWSQEHKVVETLKKVIARCTNPEKLVVNLGAGNFLATTACMLLPKHRHF